MKILFLTSRFPYPPFRGDKLRVFNFIRELSKKHQIILASFIEKHELELVEELKPYCQRIETVLLDKKRSYLNCLLHLFSRTPFQVFYYHSPQMEEMVSKLVDEERPDLIHAHLFRMAPYVTKHNVPRVLDLCDSIALNYERFLKYRRDLISPAYLVEKSKVRRYEGEILADFDRSLVVSPVDKKFLENLLPKMDITQMDRRGFPAPRKMDRRGFPAPQIEVVSNGVDLDYFKPMSAEKDPHRLVFTGTISYFPNYDGILRFHREIFPLIKEAIPDTELYVVGSGPPKQIRKLAQGDGVVVTGYVDDVRPYVSSSTVFVCPLRAATGLQNKILEAMAMGVPVVATPQALEGINAAPGRDIVVADNPNDFASEVIKLLKDAKLREELSARGRAVVEERYSWQKTGETLNQIYKEVIENAK